MSLVVEEREDVILPQKLVKIGVAQYSSISFNLEASLEKFEKICRDAASKGVKLLLLPEGFLPGYPHGGDIGAGFGHHALSSRKIFELWHNSAVEIPGPVISRISKTAQELNMFLVVGVIEKEVKSATLYCTVVFVKEDGTYLGKHRKLVPTEKERLFWGVGDASMLPVFDSPAGVVGSVICWENYMPLLRTTMYTKGIQIYCAPNADGRQNWQHTMRHIAQEGRCFVLGCNQFTRRSDYPPESVYPTAVGDKDGERVLCAGGSIIVNPLGNVLAGPNYTSEELLVAEIDVNECLRGKYDLDCVGHYSRPDLFTLYVNESSQPGIAKTVKVAAADGKENRDNANIAGEVARDKQLCK